MTQPDPSAVLPQFLGSLPTADGLRWLSREILLDEWRASELADETVQDLSGEHGERLGERPHDQVFKHAKWKALDKSVGGIRVRKGLDSELLEHIVSTLQEPGNFASDLQTKQLLDRSANSGTRYPRGSGVLSARPLAFCEPPSR